MKFWLYAAAVVLFILCAVFTFFFNKDIDNQVVFGLFFSGSACFAAAHLPPFTSREA